MLVANDCFIVADYLTGKLSSGFSIAPALLHVSRQMELSAEATAACFAFVRFTNCKINNFRHEKLDLLDILSLCLSVSLSLCLSVSHYAITS